ncbi:MAG: 50S ribosomal protein L4 [Candidatus Micrarchaeaceae archaeon]
MEANVYNINGEESGKIKLPEVFSSEFREDLIKRAIHSEQSYELQPQGHYLMAGIDTTAVYVGKYSGYRRGRHMGIAIRPRQKLGAGAMGDVRKIPSAVKGKRAHPHKIEKIIIERMNNKEYVKAIKSAIAGSTKNELLEKKHILKNNVLSPIIVENKAEEFSKAKDVISLIDKLGLTNDLEKSHKPRLRKGLSRSSNKRRFRKSVIIIAKNASKVEKAGRNIPGVDVCSIDSLTVNKLAPGGLPRVAIWTRDAVESIEAVLKKKEE